MEYKFNITYIYVCKLLKIFLVLPKYFLEKHETLV